MPKRSSSVVGREFGNGVRKAIEQTGLTQRQLTALLDRITLAAAIASVERKDDW